MTKYKIRYLKPSKLRDYKVFYDFNSTQELMQYLNTLDIKDTDIIRFTTKKCELFLQVVEQVVETNEDRSLKEIKDDIKKNEPRVILTQHWITEVKE